MVTLEDLKLDPTFIPLLNGNFSKVQKCLLELRNRVEYAEEDIFDLKSTLETWTTILNRFSLFDEEYSFQKLMDLEERLERLEKAAGIDKE